MWSEKLGGPAPLHRFEKNLAPAPTNDKEETHGGNLQCHVAGRSLLPVNKDTASIVPFSTHYQSSQAHGVIVARATIRLASDDVRFWHKADITIVLNNVRFWG